MEPRQKSGWICPACRSNQPKTGNLNTPVRCAATIEDPASPEDAGFSNVTLRSNQSNQSSFNLPTSLTEEKFREILMTEISKASSSTVAELKIIGEKMSSFHESLNFLNKKFEDLKSNLEEKSATIADLKKDNEQLKTTVHDLTIRLNAVELHMRESNVEINGIPENRSENLRDTVIQLTKAVENPVLPDDVIQVTRVAKMSQNNERPRAVVVKFRNPSIRDSVLAAVSKFNKKNMQSKLNSHHLGIGGTRSPVFVSEHLTPGNKYLHAAARQKARELSYKFVWVRNGRIYVRKSETHQAVLIKNLDSIKHLT